MTAVEWLISKIERNENPSLTQKEIIEYVNQAKEMEKQQIINTWYDCKLSIIDKNPTDADQYFNETFKK